MFFFIVEDIKEKFIIEVNMKKYVKKKRYPIAVL